MDVGRSFLAAGNVEVAATRRTGTHEHRVVSCGQYGLHRVDLLVPELDIANSRDEADFLVDHRFRKPEVRDLGTNEAAELGILLRLDHAVDQFGREIGAEETLDAAALALLLGFSSGALGQVGTGAIAGRVSDETGTPIPGAVVTVPTPDAFLPMAVLQAVAATRYLPKLRMWSHLGLLGALVVGWFVNPPYPFPVESNLAVVDFVQLQHEAAQYVESNFRGRRVATVWPLAAALRDPSAFVVYSSILSKASFALMARPEITSVEQLKGKRMGCGRVGDPPYHYTVGLIKKFGLRSGDLQWVPTGTDATARAQMLLAGQLDAALITSPSWYGLEARGLKRITGLQEHPDLGIFTGLTMRRAWAAANPDVPEKLLRAHAEAVRILYADRKVAIEIYRKYDPAASAQDCERLYDDIFVNSAIDRVPVMPRWAAESAADRLSADLPAAKNFDYQKIMDMSVARKLIAEGFYEKLFGEEVRTEQDRALREGFA